MEMKIYGLNPTIAPRRGVASRRFPAASRADHGRRTDRPRLDPRGFGERTEERPQETPDRRTPEKGSKPSDQRNSGVGLPWDIQECQRHPPSSYETDTSTGC